MGSYYGKLNSYQILYKNKESLQLVQDLAQTLSFDSQVFVRNPWAIKDRIEGVSFKQFMEGVEDVYSMECKIEKKILNIYSFREFIISSFVFDPVSGIEPNLLNTLILLDTKSEIGITGFEIDLYIDEYPSGLITLVNDESIYPLYLNLRRNKNRYFRLSHSPSGLNEYIEKFLNRINQSANFIDQNRSDMELILKAR